MIQIHRVYDGAMPAGEVYLVERLWPRGMRKASLALAGWAKEAAPSTGLRRWFGHDPEKWGEFRRRYFAELDARPEAWAPLLAAARRGPVVFLYSARDTAHNNAVALKAYMETRLKHAEKQGPESGVPASRRSPPRPAGCRWE